MTPPPLPSDPPDWAGYKVFLDERTFHSEAKPEHVWTIIEGIGGKNGWYSLPLAWRVRGWLDKLQGGAGLLRGRRHPKTLNTGEVVDWWRVEAIDRGHLLRLRAEMRAPGGAWLELAVEPMVTAASISNAPSSSRAAWLEGSTGLACTPSTGSFFPQWPATFLPRPLPSRRPVQACPPRPRRMLGAKKLHHNHPRRTHGPECIHHPAPQR